ncbi:MAG: hypothetical protein ACI9W2_005321, partial [Gammaproteobacteria bacterium]
DVRCWVYSGRDWWGTLTAGNSQKQPFSKS